MHTRQSVEQIPPQKSSPSSKIRPIVAGALTIALGTSGVFLAGSSASAAPGYAEAEGRYLSGTLLDQSLDDLAALSGEKAIANSTTDRVVTESGDLDLSVLQSLVELQVADGITIPLSVADAGAVTQYAQASQSGDSRGAAGAVTDQGAIDLESNPGAPESLSFNLTDLVGEEVAASVADVALTAGVTTATARQAAGSAAVGDYNIAGLEASINSPILTALSADLISTGNVLDESVASTIGPDGSLATDLTGVLNGLGVAEVTVSGSTDLSAVIEQTLQANQILGVDGPVQVDLTSGQITVDIAALLEANGRDLNDLEPGEEILSSELVGFVTAEVDGLLNGLLTEVQTAVNTALDSTELTIAASVGTLVDLNLDGTLGEISSGAVEPQITLLGTDLDLGLLTGPITSAVSAVLALQIDTAAVDVDLEPLYPALDSVLSDLVSLRANLQNSEAGVFTQTALQLSVLNFEAEGQLLGLNLAQASVGPNVGATQDPAPMLLGLDPVFGPEAGGTEVTITGTDLSSVDTVTFGGVEATNLVAVSPTEITVETPAGVGVVDVVASGPAGSATIQDGFTYVPAGEDAGTIVSYTPTTGPEAGGTEVTIIGSGFEGSQGVNFGETAGTNFTVVSDNEITVNSPAGTGSVVVTVVGNPNGDIQAPVPFQYVPANGGNNTNVIGVDPSSGPEAGGTLVTITGGGFSTVNEVFFNGVIGAELQVISDTELTVVTPAGVGQVPIVLNNGTGSTTSPIPFQYVPAEGPVTTPIVDSVTPDFGPETGGTVVVIIGENFNEGDTVNFGGAPATDVVVVDGSTITATAPAGTGIVDVTVTNGAGESGTLPQSYTYVPANDNGGGSTPPPVDNGNGNGNGGANNGSNGGANGSSNSGSNSDNAASSSDNRDTKPLATTGSEMGYGIAAALLLLVGGGALLIRRKLTA